MKLIFFWLLDLLFPPKCALCGRLLQRQETDFCEKCRRTTPEFPALPRKEHPNRKTKLQFLDSFTAVWYYNKNVRSAVLNLKFHGRRDLAAPLGRKLAMKLMLEQPDAFDLVTWAPVSGIRKFRRGFDQSQLLAQTVSRELGIPALGLLKKRRNNRPQSTLTAEDRRKNVQGIYHYAGDVPLTGERILLIDDVFTTGSTAEECAKVLLAAGAGSVCCGAIAAAEHAG